MNERLILMTKRVLLSCVMLSTTHAEWEALPSLPEPNGGFMCGVVSDKIVVVGGTNWEGGKKNWLKTVHVFDLVAKQWSRAKELEATWAYGPTFHGKDGFGMLGGFDGKGAAGIFAWGATDRIELRHDFDLPKSLVLAAGGAVGEMLVVCGGTDDPANLSGVTRSTYSFRWGDMSPGMVHLRTIIRAWSNSSPGLSLSGNFEIVRMADYPGKGFATAASAVVGSELFVFGGMNYDAHTKLPVNTDVAYAFLPKKNTWRPLKCLQRATRGLSAVALDEKHIYLSGGYTDDFTARAEIYDVSSDSYHDAKALPYAAMVSLLKHDGFVYCLGGEDKKQSRTDKFFRIAVAELLK